MASISVGASLVDHLQRFDNQRKAICAGVGWVLTYETDKQG